jgi:glycosyltransferase involved in cell wall biosynthesis
MRWLLLNHNLRERGTWHRAWGLARELARRGEHVALWTAAPHHYYRPAHEHLDGVEIVETPSWAPLAGADDGWGPLDLAWRLAHAATARCDVVYAFAHPPTVCYPAWLLHRLRGKPLLYDWCDWYAGGIFAKREERRMAGLGATREKPLQPWAERRELALERGMPRLADGVTVISEKLRELTLRLGVPPERILLLPNGAALERFAPRDPQPCRAALGLPATGELLVYIANYHPDEDFFLRALARAVALRPGLMLVLAGPPFTPKLVEQLGLAGHIIGLGLCHGEKLAQVLGAAEALALPMENHLSNIARLPFKFTDYLAAGRPQVTCRVGDIAVYFDRATHTVGPIGLAAPAEVEAYGRALAEIFQPRHDRIAMGRAARQFAEQEFSWARLTQDVLDFLPRVAPTMQR